MLGAAFLLWLAACAAACRATFAQERPADFGGLERSVLEELRSTQTPGAAVAVVSGERVVFAKAFGVANLETGEAVTTDMLFRGGPLTGVFTAAALLSLDEEGRLKLDEPVGRYVKGLGPRTSLLTGRQLLTHTSGLREEHESYGLFDDAELGRAVRAWGDDYCLLEPGRMYSHSNPGYALAGLLIQEAAGKPYAAFVRERLFQPLGMERTTFRPTLIMTFPFSQSYRATGGARPSLVRPYALDSLGWPGGSMFTSADELARFAVAFLNGGRLDGRQALSPSLIGKLSAPFADIPGGAHEQKGGYGFVVEDHRGVRVLSASGSWAGFTAQMRLVPEHRFAFIVLSNRNASFFDAPAEKAMELLLPLRPAPPARMRNAQPMTEAEMAGYAGTYENEDVVEIVSRGGRLYLRERGAESPVTKWDEHLFSAGRVGALQLTFDFIKGPDGRVRYLHRAGRALKKSQT